MPGKRSAGVRPSRSSQLKCMMRSVRTHASVSFLFAAGAAGGLWLWWRCGAFWLQAVVEAMALLAFVHAIYALRQRHRAEATRLSGAAVCRLVVFGGVVLVLACGSAGSWLAYHRAWDIVHPARSQAWRTPDWVGIDRFREVSFHSADGLVPRGWYAPPRNGAVVIFVHGLGANRGQLLDDAAMVYREGYGVLLYDSRNCGESEGTLTTLGYQEAQDVLGAVDLVLSQTAGDEPRIGLLGHSMGGATAILAAAQDGRVDAVTAQSTYASLEAILGSSLKQITGLPGFPFAPLVVYFGELEAGIRVEQVRPVDAIGLLSPRPVLVMHGALDEVIPVSNAYDLFAAAREPKQLYIRELLGFLERHLLGR